MKKMFKKGLSLLLAVMMVISVIPASTLISASASAASLGYVVGDTVEFGSYPQSKVTDSALVEELNALTLEWKSFGFMSGDGNFGSMTESDYMKYADVELAGEKYRAVTFSQYRPNLAYIASTEKNSHQDDNGYFTDAVYWFKYEPIKWSIVDAEKGLIMSESLIDAQGYSETVYCYDNGGSTEDNYYLDSAHRTYANDYKDSSIREWLNDDFYNTAFSGEEKSKVLTDKIDNTAVVSKYDSSSVRDRVFLLSSDDVKIADMGFESDSDRIAEGTDYAKALGLYVPESGESSFWWLRTPGSYSYYACRVDNSGKTDEYGNTVDFTNYGVRPVIRYDFDGTGERYTATFLVDGEIYAQNSYVPGEEIFAPASPEKEGFVFEGWDKEIPDTMEYENLTFNAVWNSVSYTIVFDANGGEFSDGSSEYIINAEYDSVLEIPDDPVRDGYTFCGWEPYVSELVEGDATYVATWDANEYTVAYYVDGEIYETFSVLFGDEIDVPADPYYEGREFLGWSDTEGGEIVELPATMPADDLDFYAVWERGIVSVEPGEGSGIVIDNEKMLITGVPEGVTEAELREMLTVIGDGYIEIALTDKNKIGTGSVVTLYDNLSDEKLCEYRIAILGDLDGDGIKTGNDAKILYEEIVDPEWSSTRGSSRIEYLCAAANANGDRRISMADFDDLGFATYHINVYTMNADGSYDLAENSIGYGLVGETVSYTPDSVEEGFCIDTEKSVLEGVLLENDLFEISVYYARGRYSVTYIVDGYEWVRDDYFYGDAIYPPADPEKEGHVFVGWTPYIPETMPATDLYFEAIYQVKSYHIEFDAGEGCFADGSNSISMVLDYGEYIDMFELPTRDGYIFVGWDDGNGGALPVQMPAENLYLTAVWEPITDTPYTIETYIMDTAGEYNLYGITTCAGTTGTVALIEIGELEGFYVDEENSVTSGIIEADGSTVLKVYYARNLHTVTFNVDGIVYAESDYYYGSILVEPVQPEKDGYSFIGWAVEGSGEIATLPQTVEGDLSFVAVFSEECEYTVTLDANGGLFDDGETVKTLTAKAGETVEIDVEPTRESYMFAGWDKEIPFTMPDCDVTLEAVWYQDLHYCHVLDVERITESHKQQNLLYEIEVCFDHPEKVEFLKEESGDYVSKAVFDRNEAFVSGDLTETGIVSIRYFDYDTGEEITDISNFSGYYNEVWTVVASLPEGEYKVRTKLDSSDDSWEAIDLSYEYDLEYDDVSFDLILDANGGWFAKNDTNILFIMEIYGESIAEYYEEPTKDGYKFMGWEDENGNVVVIDGTMPDINGTLYAVWEELSSAYEFEITFDACGGYFDDGESVYTVYANYDDVLQYPPEPYMEGFTFCGWEPYVSEIVEVDATYYATWEPNEYMVTYYVDGEVYEAYSVYYGDELDVPADPYIEGFTFIGWSASEGGYAINLPATMPAMDLEFFAVWEEETTTDLITGTCGENLTWSFDESTGELVISGEGAMGDYATPGREYASIINTVYIDDGVTSICEWAFSGFDSLTSVKIGNSVTSIGYWAFAYCPSLTSVAIGDSVTSIGDFAFEGCTSLSSITVGSANTAYSNDEYGVLLNKDKTELIQYPIGNTRTSYVIPDSVTIIGDYAFSYCDILTSVTIPDSVISIGGFAFEYCESLTSVSIGNGVTSIGDRAFYDCGSLTSVSIGNSVTSIGDYAFYDCGSLTSVSIGNSVTSIGDSAFRDCTILTSVTIPDSVTSIGDYAFCDCTSLSSITIGNGATYIGDSAFWRCTSLSDVYYTGTEKDWNAITIGLSNDLLTDATIHFESTGPAPLNVVTPEANLASSGANEVNDSDIVTGEYKNITWSFDRNMYELVISGEGDMPDFGMGSAPWTDHICGGEGIYLTIENGITSIGDYAFCYGIGVTYVSIPESVTSIGNNPFCYCEGINYIIVDTDNPSYSSDKNGVLFNKDKTELIKYPVDNSVVSYEIPGTVEHIGDYAFQTAFDLEEIIIPDSVKSIGDYAFSLSGLTSVTIPDSVESLGAAAFESCGSLTNVKIGNGLKNIGYSFADCGNLISVTIGNSVETIDDMAFYVCSSLTSITIPFGVTSIGEEAFYGCYALGEIYYEGSEEEWNAISIGECNDALSYATIHFNWNPTGIINLSNASVNLEFTEAYYLGEAVIPAVYLQYGDELFDAKKELSITYSDNNKVGKAKAILEGLNRFSGSAELEFTISYEEIPEQIVNVTALGEIEKILLSWGISSEVGTQSYNVYRRNEGSDEYTLITTVNGRETLSYTDTAVEEGKTYIYYITGVGTYGAESLPSAEVYATVQSDKEIPTVYKLKPASGSVLYATQTLSISAEDNIGIAKAVYSWSEDEGATWNVIGEATGEGFACKFDTTVVKGSSVSVKVVVYDTVGNASEDVVNTYKIDNVGPEKVTGLSAIVQSSIITLSWNNVADADAKYFILQQKTDGVWITVQTNLITRGANVENLQAETDYTFRVACVDVRGNVGQYSDEYTVRTAVDTMIPAITGQSPSPARYSSAFTYTATAQDECGIASIKIQYSYDEESWTDIGSKTFSDAERIQKYSLTINTDEYKEGYLYIRAIATDISGNESVSDSTAPYRGYYIDRTAPDAPTGLKAISQDGYISLEWTVGTENDLGGYAVYRATEENGEYKVISSNLATYNYHDQTVERGKEYYYKIRVSDTCGNMSGYSEIVSAKMLDDTIKPVVRGIGSTYNNSLSKSYNYFNVAASDNNMLSYMVVEYCTTKNMTYAEAARAESIADSYKNLSVKIPMDGLESGDKVYVRAYAVDVMGLKSDYVNAQYTVDLTAPSATDFKATIVNNKVTLTWNDCREADLAGFKVYYSANGKDYTSAGARGVNGEGIYTLTHYITSQQSGTYYYKLVSLDKLQNASELITSVEYTYIESPGVIVNEAPVASFICKSFMILNVEDEFDASASTDDSQITEYIWDFGDGTSSTEIRPVKKYTSVGTYEVTLTVKDAEGLQHSVTQTVEVKEREKLGTLKVRVVDENGSPVPYAPVYFDLGSNNNKKVAADSSGVAIMLLPDGTHTVGAYKDHYLPAKKEIVVLANATRTITLTIVKGDIITGEFEITRMTFDEIIAAGIDPYAPDNRQVYSATARFIYSGSAISLDYYRNGAGGILGYSVRDEEEKERKTFIVGGEERKVTDVVWLGGDGNKDIVGILDVPAQASYLKEFFDVKLHIINNAASDFVIKDNEIKLNVPEGMTLMTGLDGGYQNSDTVHIDRIKGQNTVTISWCIRGDVAGEYNLTADYTGILAEFEELVTTTFKTDEPIKVYGLEGVKFRILGADEIHNDTFYFNVELENERPVDILLPDISVINNKVTNVTDRVLGTDNAVFESTAYLLNIYVQLGNGKKQYLPISYSRTGNLSANLEVLAPGQKLVHEYVAYNAINYDGIAHFRDAAIVEFEGLLENIEVGSFHKERYSFIDYSEKLGNILSGDAKVRHALNYINNDGNYYYVDEANTGKVMKILYNLANTVINADPSGFEDDEMKDKAKDILLSVLTDADILGKIDELTGQKYYYAINEYLSDVKAALEGKHDQTEINKAFEELFAKADWLTEKYVVEGSIEFYDSVTSIIDNHLTSASLEVLQFTPYKYFGKNVDTAIAWTDTIFDALTGVQQDVYVQGVLKFESNVEYSNFILDAILQASKSANSDISSAMVSLVKDFKKELNQSVKQFQSKAAEIVQYSVKEVTYHLVGKAVNDFVTNCIGSTVMSVVKVVFNFAMWALGIDDYMKQKAVLSAYDQIGDAFLSGFMNGSSVTNSVKDFYYLTLLRAGCETRLGGEATYKQFIIDYIGGTNLDEIEEAEALDAINDVKNTSYSSIDSWYDVVQYNIVSSRDTLFNIEFTETNIPSAPSVTLDYANCQTVQSFAEEYEYCFGDGVWRKCNGKPIGFELKTVPQTLRVRVAASSTNLAGEITTVRIYAQKELSKLITVKYDDGKYIFSNLTSQRSYEMVLLNSSLSTPDWSRRVFVNDSKATGAESDYIAIRSRLNSNLLETNSLPLVLKVQKKQVLDLTIKGDGTVEQSNTSGEYFVGDTVDLIATPHEGCEFLGWYVDGELVSKDVHYILEYYDGVKVKAEFTGVTVKSIEIETMPSKLVYTVGEKLSTEGMTLRVRYSDLSTRIISSGFVCSESVFAKDGETTVTVAYGGETTQFTVNVYKEYYTLTFVVEGVTTVYELKFGETIDFDINVDRVGYNFIGWTPEVPATMPAQDLMLTATYEPEVYEVVFDANGGVFADGTTYMNVSVDYDTVIAAPTAPEKQGYLFAGWLYNGENLGENLGTMNSVEDMVFTAEWIASTDTVYTVETYVMDTTGEYVLSTQIMSGTTGETVTVEPVIDEGFELNREKSSLSGVISGDNSLVLSVYIDRLMFTLTVDDGTETVSETYYYGAMIAPVETPSKTGYTFVGWDNEIPATMPAMDLTVTAMFDVNSYNAVFMNGSETFATISVRYSEKIVAPETVPEKEGFNFVGWSLDSVIILADLGTMDETGKTFYAVWQANEPEHVHIPQTITIDATCTVNGIEYTICMECGETIGESTILPALNHSKTQTVTIDATCTVAGMKYEICEFCGETIGDAVVLPALGHTAGEWETTKNPTCTEKGEQIKKCTVCGVTVETKELEVLGHTAGEWETTKNPTCTEKGEQIKKCTVCGVTVETKELEALGHTPAKEWTVVLKPTTEKEGKRVIKCTVCKAVLEEDVITKLEVAHHDDTDITIEYQPDDYEGEVSINVEETFDGGAFNIVNTQTGSAKSQIFDITMTVDGKETQPESKVTIRIPLPEGYDPNRSFVYHVDSKTGKVEKMNSRYENGYLVFETDHFSYYAVVDESKVGAEVTATVTIAQPSITTVKYGDTLILHAEIKGDIPEGAKLEWSVVGEGMTIEPSADGKTCAVTSTSKGEVTVTVKVVDKNGNAVVNSEGTEIGAQQKLTSKAGFFQKLISFFKNLFGMNRIIAQIFKPAF
ncbi:MAG: leucine-rich repeat protein [Clostridia bacterium]|nr:leucine-rich repeat protein [Clostridia bacterium]